MIDTYIQSDNFADLASFCSSFRNVIGPVQGSAAAPEQLQEDGTVVPEREAVGDPSKFYACIRAPFSVPVSSPLAVCADDVGAAVCGEWA